MKLKRKIRKLIIYAGVVGFGFLVVLGGCQRREYDRRIGQALIAGAQISFQADKVVQVKAQEPEKIEWAETAKMIIDEFAPLGKTITYQALQVAWCESKWQEQAINPLNKNGTNDKGVFMINSCHKLGDNIRLNQLNNIRWAKQKFIRDGYSWGAWSCKPR